MKNVGVCKVRMKIIEDWIGLDWMVRGMERKMERWKDGRMEGWKDGRMRWLG